MSRSGRNILIATIAAFIAWILGTALVGTAEEHHMTASGLVDMTNALDISRAMKDPTFTASLSWGSVSLNGLLWSTLLPVLLAALAFVGTLVFARGVGKRRDK